VALDQVNGWLTMDHLICLIFLVWEGIQIPRCVYGFYHISGISRPCIHRALERSKGALCGKSPSSIQPNLTDTITGISQKVLYVGNLDWNVDTIEWEKRIRSILEHTTNVNTGEYFSIDFRNKTSRQRDMGKYHGGSMLVAFSNTTAAANSLNTLLNLQHQTMSNLSATPQHWLTPLRLQYHRPQTLSLSPLQEISDEELAIVEERRRERAAAYARRRGRAANTTDIMISQLQKAMSTLSWNLTNDTSVAHSSIPVLQANELDWSIAPSLIDPALGGGLQGPPHNNTAPSLAFLSDRASRKRAAVEAFLEVVQNGLLGSDSDSFGKRRTRIVADLGSGAGNLALPLSWWMNYSTMNNESISYQVLGVDLNKISLMRLRERARLVSSNSNKRLVETLEMDLLGLAIVVDKIQSPLTNCSAVVSLHACGASSDLAIETAVRHGLPFAISPCCIGKALTLRSGIEHVDVDIAKKETKLPLAFPTQRGSAPIGTISYPRSKWLLEIVSPENYRLLASAADYGVRSSCSGESDVDEFKRWRRSRQAKTIIEIDRLQWAFEHGYYVRILELPRLGPLYSKREVLLGAIQGSPAAIRISKLPVSN
jgi:Methyltransferase domain